MEEKAGKPKKQAVAIALNVARDAAMKAGKPSKAPKPAKKPAQKPAKSGMVDVMIVLPMKKNGRGRKDKA